MRIIKSRLDHIVICATTLQQGIDYLHDKLGVVIPLGGEHPRMSTHNCVMQLGENVYLELISINPNAPPPERPRWFAMDDANNRLAIAEQPALITWVANTDDLDQTTARAPYPYPAGTPMSRPTKKGVLKWSITIPDDGALPAGGMLPTLIQWPKTTIHPAQSMANLGCSLHSLTVFHPHQQWMIERLRAIGCADLINVVALPVNSAPYLEANIDSPKGRVTLQSPC